MSHVAGDRWSPAARVWYGAIAAVVLAALIIQLVLIFTGGADANSGQSGTAVSVPVRLWRLFSFFTVESNIVVMIVCVFLVADPRRRGRWWDIARLNALLAITITGLVFAIILAPQLHLTGWALTATILFHYISPWTFVAGWLVFGPRPRFRWSTVAGAFILPIAWLFYIFIQGAFTHWYPYPFLDVTRIGLGAALFNAVLVLVVAAVLAAIFKLIDAKIPSVLADSPVERVEIPSAVSSART
ncbi:Pr6Pr family membrane protein [Leifsonia sp. NPDC077715]|uniref:Pr6Pr family membrane protein n=1 Tax=Leifsonia sp. NPDC077715 TaxID=3155539 RepID=UPI00341D1755